jgi:hypothetical protein
MVQTPEHQARSRLLDWHPSAVVALLLLLLLGWTVVLLVALRAALRMTLVVLAVVVVRISRLCVHVGRIVGGMVLTGIVLRRLMHSSMHWGRHGSGVHVHFLVGWVHVVLLHCHCLSLGFFVLLFLFSFSDRIHSVVLVSFALIELLFFRIERLPSRTNETGDGASLGRNATLRVLQTKNVSGKEHVVSCLVALAVGLLVGRLVHRHLFLVTRTIAFGPAVESNKQSVRGIRSEAVFIRREPVRNYPSVELTALRISPYLVP